MAKVLFTKTHEHLKGNVLTIFKNDEELPLSKINLLFYTAIDISELDYQNVVLGKKRIINYLNNTVVYENIDGDFYKNKEDLKTHISFFINEIDKLLKNKPDYWNYNKLSVFLNVLKNFNYDEIQYPMTMTFQEHLNSKNIEIPNILYLI
jgi:hypothetical protein